jgi:UDP-glucose 4-epimerase
VHDRDLARAAVLAALHPGAAGGVFNVTDGRIHTVGQVGDAICGALGKGCFRVSVPWRGARLIVAATAKLELSFSFLSGIRNLIDRMSTDTAVSGSRIQRELGFRPEVDLHRGWVDAVERYLNKRK